VQRQAAYRSVSCGINDALDMFGLLMLEPINSGRYALSSLSLGSPDMNYFSAHLSMFQLLRRSSQVGGIRSASLLW